jgi:Mrp family chromosome partitioning ATPase
VDVRFRTLASRTLSAFERLSERMHAILEAIPDGYDLVVLDTPPRIISDAMPMFRFVGGVVVGRLGTRTHDSTTELRDQVENVGAPTLRVVVNCDYPNRRAYG